jgi:23S rRNA (uracil1939-C5)-methyltransferase
MGDLLELEIEKLVFRGMGLARWTGLTVFVPCSAEGDILRARVTQVRAHYLEAETEEILIPSSQRTQPFCCHFPACGGCQWQHLSLAAQRECKAKILREQLFPLQRRGGLPSWEILPTSRAEAYRTRAQMKVRREGNRSRLGFFRPRSRDLEEVDTCPLLHPDLHGIHHGLRDLRYPALGQLFPALKEVWFQRGSAGGEVVLALMAPFGERAALRLLYQRLKEVCPNLNGIALAFRSEKGAFDVVGNPWVEMAIAGLKLKAGPTCFYQVGKEGAEGIFQVIETWAALGKRARVLDLYCGVGAFSLPLARRAEEVVGVEAHPEAAILAKENAERAGLSNVTVFHGMVEEVLSRDRMRDRFDLVILDPPRPGLSRKAMEGLLRLASRRIIYISCDPSTLARDLDRLMGHGYECLRIQPLDLFPQTYHMETLVLLERRTQEHWKESPWPFLTLLGERTGGKVKNCEGPATSALLKTPSERNPRSFPRDQRANSNRISSPWRFRAGLLREAFIRTVTPS